MDKVVELKRYEDGLSILMLNRPEKRNAISKESVKLLNEYADLLANDSETKLLIVTGKGEQAFCAGGDLRDFHGEMNQQEAYDLLKPMKDVLFKIVQLPFPTLAWMNGSARGGGMELSSACDFRFASRSGDYGFVQGKLGISAGWGGGALLYHRIHPQQAYYWLLESEIKTAESLHQAGFIQEILEENDKFEIDSPLLERFLSKSPEQLRWWKKQWLDSISLDELSEKMDEEVLACSKLWESDAHKEAVKRFFSK